MNPTTAGERDGRRQRFIKQHIKVDQRLAFELLDDRGAGKRGADLRDGAVTVDAYALDCRQRARERGGKGRGRIKAGRWIEAGGTLDDIAPALAQSFHFVDQRLDRHRLDNSQPDRRLLVRPLTPALSPHAGRGRDRDSGDGCE